MSKSSSSSSGLLVLSFASGACLVFLVILFTTTSETTNVSSWLNFARGSNHDQQVTAALDPCSAPSKGQPPPADLNCVLRRAAMENSTVMITTLNDAWAQPGSLLDLFFDSFRVGNGTQRLLKHLVIVAVDGKAYNRCIEVHPHCFFLRTEGADFSGEKMFMTEDYIGMMWRRIDFLRVVLELGYTFVFTDTDIMWLRDPFPHLRKTTGDLAIACDMFTGNSTDEHNGVNGGFTYVKSNNHTIQFYKYWYASRVRFPGEHDQQVFNRIKGDSFVVDLGIKFWYLDTDVFSGFCEHGNDLSRVCTMHSNCCIGLQNKLHDLRMVLEDWGNFTSTLLKDGNATSVSWRIPSRC